MSGTVQLNDDSFTVPCLGPAAAELATREGPQTILYNSFLQPVDAENDCYAMT